jgi:hypothetical protein
MEARVIEFCDAVVAAILASWVPVSPNAVSSEYEPDFDIATITGRKVYVFPAGYGQAGTVTRGEDENEYRVSVIIMERYTDEGAVPKAWLNARVLWVQNSLYVPLTDARAASILGESWPETGDVTTVYDLDVLRDYKVFLSEIEIAYREIA